MRDDSHTTGEIAGVLSTAATAPPWRKRSWIDEASAWIREQAQRAGRAPVGRVVAYKLTERKAFLGAETPRGRLFMKCCLAAAHEARLTTLLSQRYPAHFAPVVAVDSQRAWLLMEEVQGRPLMLTADPSCWARALKTFADIQLDFTRRADDLAEIGCPDRTWPWVGSRLARLAESHVVCDGMSDTERSELLAAIPVWHELLSLQATSPVPHATLDHGDFHPGNILVTERGPVFLDWEGGSIGHAFCAPLTLFAYLEEKMPTLVPARDVIRTAYLRAWSAGISMTTLEHLFEGCRAVAALRYAVVRAILVDQGVFDPEEVVRVRGTVLMALRVAMRAAAQHRTTRRLSSSSM